MSEVVMAVVVWACRQCDETWDDEPVFHRHMNGVFRRLEET